MLLKQVSIFVQNKTGRMAQVARLIANLGIDIRSLYVADTSDFGIMRLIVDKPEQAMEALKAEGLAVSLTDVLAIGMEDKPGTFASVLEIFEKFSIDIEYMYAFITRNHNQAVIIVRVDDNMCEKSINILTESGISLIKPTDIYNRIN